MTTPHIIVTGNVVEGFEFFGPYPTFDAAAEVAEHPSCYFLDWKIVPLQDPNAPIDTDKAIDVMAQAHVWRAHPAAHGHSAKMGSAPRSTG